MESKDNKKKFLLRFGEEIRTARETRGWTQEYASLLGGLSSRQHLTDLEAGKKEFDVFTLLRLTKIYGSIVTTLIEVMSEDFES